MDRGYLDFGRLFSLHQSLALFVTRAKSKIPFQHRYSRAVDNTAGLICDQTVMLTGFYPARRHPAVLRRVGYIAPDVRMS